MSIIFQKRPQNYTYTVGVCNFVDNEFDDITRSFPAIDAVLHNVVIPANTLIQDGQRVIIYSEFTLNEHPVSNVVITVRQNTSNFCVLTIPPNPDAHALEMEINIVRKAVNFVDIITKAFINHAQGNNAVSLITHGSHSQLGISVIQQITIDWLATDNVGLGNIQQRFANVIVQ